MGILSRTASYLTRRTSGRALIPEIDGLRSIAILSVVIFHAHGNFVGQVGEDSSQWLAQFLGEAMATGEYGVPLFFVISGFILALPFANRHFNHDRPVSLTRYFKRRVTRLEPPYVFMLCFALFARFRVTGEFLSWLPNFFASLFYVHNIVFDRASQMCVIAWSLEVEVQFYLLAPILTMVFAIRNPRLRRLVFVAGIAIMSVAFGTDKPVDGLNLLNHASYFLSGMLFADIYLLDLQAPSKPSWSCDAVALLCLAALFGSAAFHVAPAIVSPWLILITYVAVFKSYALRRLFSWTPIVILGGMCYSIYLWHLFLIAVFQRIVFQLLPIEFGVVPLLLYVLSASIFAIAGSALFFALIERPTMNPRWPQDLATRVRAIVRYLNPFSATAQQQTATEPVE